MTIQKILGLFIFCGVFSAQQQMSSLTVEQFRDQPLPVRIVGAQLSTFQYTSELSAQISTDAASEPISANMMLLIYRNGKVVSGEGWTEEKPTNSLHRQTKLAFAPGDHALLMVRSVKTRSGIMQLKPQDMNDAIKALTQGTLPRLPSVELSMLPNLPHAKVQRVQGAYCTTCYNTASSACGVAGVQSFSCDDKNQNFSFTCKGNTPVQPPPVN